MFVIRADSTEDGVNAEIGIETEEALPMEYGELVLANKVGFNEFVDPS